MINVDILYHILHNMPYVIKYVCEECTQLRARVPSCPTCLACLLALHASRAYVSHVPTCSCGYLLTCLTFLRAFVPLLLKCLHFFTCFTCLHSFTCLTCLHFLRALRAFNFLRALRGFIFLRAYILKC